MEPVQLSFIEQLAPEPLTPWQLMARGMQDYDRAEEEARVRQIKERIKCGL